ncbi:MAG: arginine deiminase [Bacteroidales bacterium]|nr:arginine deiminase [Bacteroidales bacterium]
MDNKIRLYSEIGKLNAVLLHRPGIEIERMTPENAHEALYSDILNKKIVDGEYANFEGVLSKWTKTYQVVDLLAEVLKNENVKKILVETSCRLDDCAFLCDELLSHDEKTLARELVEGFEYRREVDPAKYEEERFILKPLYNLFFTRDAASSVYDLLLMNSMSFKVRQRENIIYRAIFENYFDSESINAAEWEASARTEGGDVLIARDDTLFIGNGIRTNKKGIEFLAQYFGSRKPKFNILVQELPETPESFIHLDMVFTFLDRDRCMMYEPIIRKNAKYSHLQTTHIEIDNGKITYHQKQNFLQGAKDLGFDLNPVVCGGNDAWTQQREQWHSGANFFALGEGKIIGYERNWKTIEALDKAGFSVLKAADVCKGLVDMHNYEKFVVTFSGSELPRGGGGARCMTMPISREDVNW